MRGESKFHGASFLFSSQDQATECELNALALMDDL
jgi:hypothetical protein